MDIGIRYVAPKATGAPGYFDHYVSDGQLATEQQLETAIILSLFVDRRAQPGDPIPTGQTDPRGWWGNELLSNLGDEYGSLLWLLEREKQTDATLQRAREYAQEALQWLAEDGVADSVTVSATWVGDGVMEMIIQVKEPQKVAATVFQYAWRAIRQEFSLTTT